MSSRISYSHEINKYMRLLHDIAIFQTVKSKVIISLFETVKLSVSISLRNLYNSLNSIKEKVFFFFIIYVIFFFIVIALNAK